MTLPVPEIEPGSKARANQRKAAARAVAALEPLAPMDITPKPRVARPRREPRPDFPHLHRAAYGPPSRRLPKPGSPAPELDAG